VGGVGLLRDDHQVAADRAALAGTTSTLLQVLLVELDVAVVDDG